MNWWNLIFVVKWIATWPWCNFFFCSSDELPLGQSEEKLPAASVSTPNFGQSGDETEIDEEFHSLRRSSRRPTKTPPDAVHSFFNSPESLPSPPLIPTPYTQKLEQNIHQRFAAVADHFNNPSDSEMDFEVNTCPRLPDNSTQCHIGVHSTEVSAAKNVPVLQSQTALNDTLLLSPSVPPGNFCFTLFFPYYSSYLLDCILICTLYPNLFACR